MPNNNYSMAGWLALAAAILFPLGFVIGIIQGVIGAAAFHYSGPMVGPSDLIFIVFAAIVVYTLLTFRRLLNDRYQFHELDLLIMIAIWWNVIFTIGGIGLKLLLLLLAPMPELALILIAASFMVVSMVTAGIIDLLFGMKLLKIKGEVSELMKAYAYIYIVSGALSITVVLSILALVLVPVSMVVLSMIFLREKEEAEFV